MSQNENTINRSLRVSEDVLADIIYNAAMEVDGVVAVPKGKKSPTSFVRKKRPSRDIRVALAGDVLDISVGVVLNSSAKAVTTAENVQNKIKSSVQNMLGLTVTKVNVTVCDSVADN